MNLCRTINVAKASATWQQTTDSVFFWENLTWLIIDRTQQAGVRRTFSGASSWTAWPHCGRTCIWNFPVNKQETLSGSISFQSYQQNLNSKSGLCTLHLSYSEVFVESVHTCTMESSRIIFITLEVQMVKLRFHLQAGAALVQNRWEKVTKGLGTSHPSTFLSLTAPLAKWRGFLLSSVLQKCNYLLCFSTQSCGTRVRDRTSCSSSFILFLLDSSSPSSSSSSSIMPSPMLLDTPGLLVDSSHLETPDQSQCLHINQQLCSMCREKPVTPTFSPGLPSTPALTRCFGSGRSSHWKHQGGYFQQGFLFVSC